MQVLELGLLLIGLLLHLCALVDDGLVEKVVPLSGCFLCLVILELRFIVFLLGLVSGHL